MFAQVDISKGVCQSWKLEFFRDLLFLQHVFLLEKPRNVKQISFLDKIVSETKKTKVQHLQIIFKTTATNQTS